MKFWFTLLIISMLVWGVSGTDWPMFHRNLNHIGYSPDDAPDTNETLWNYTTGDNIDTSSPAIVSGVVFIGSEDDKMYALNASTGAHIWNYTSSSDIDSSPAVFNGRVFFTAQDGYLYALNETGGGHIWNYSLGGWPTASPAVDGGLVFVSSSTDFRIYAFNETTGEQIWNYTVGDIPESPAVGDGVVFVGSDDNSVYALNASTGAHIWNYTMGSSTSPATVSNNKVFIGSLDSKLYALNETSGEQIWNYSSGRSNAMVSRTPAIANNRVFFIEDFPINLFTGEATDNFTVYALNETNGAYIWNYTPGGKVEIHTPPSVADGKVFFGSSYNPSGPSNSVYALNESTGSVVWVYKTGGYIYSAPSICDGILYIGSYDNKLYAFGVSASPDTTPPSVTINHPTASTYNTTTVTLNTTVTDDTAVDQCWYSLNSWLTNVSYDCVNTTLNASEGSNTVNVGANDTLGNANTTESVTFTVDVTNPNTTINWPPTKIATKSTQPSFNITVTDNLDVTLNCSIIVDGSIVVTNSSVLNNTATLLTPTSALSNGWRNWTCRCTDSSDNVGETDPRWLQIRYFPFLEISGAITVVGYLLYRRFRRGRR